MGELQISPADEIVEEVERALAEIARLHLVRVHGGVAE